MSNAVRPCSAALVIEAQASNVALSSWVVRSAAAASTKRPKNKKNWRMNSAGGRLDHNTSFTRLRLGNRRATSTTASTARARSADTRVARSSTARSSGMASPVPAASAQNSVAAVGGAIFATFGTSPRHITGNIGSVPSDNSACALTTLASASDDILPGASSPDAASATSCATAEPLENNATARRPRALKSISFLRCSDAYA
mmetsp:Transcript_9410/g.26189  ORF Transcript_9410/g.26189 Transcript_9410/m.26189 type:complete len:202 (+) Transcript_9410:320-925(+)